VAQVLLDIDLDFRVDNYLLVNSCKGPQTMDQSQLQRTILIGWPPLSKANELVFKSSSQFGVKANELPFKHEEIPLNLI
jgi:hypothetical protein